MRKKSKKENIYLLNGKKFSAVRNDVPPEVAKVLKVTTQHFQAQLDSPYLFDVTPGQVSRELNQIIDLSIIDDTLANVASELRTARTAVTVCEERLREARKAKKKLAWVDELAADLDRLEALEQAAAEINSKRVLLAALVKRGSNLADRSRTLQTAAEDGLIAVKTAKRFQERHQRTGTLENLLSAIDRAQTAAARKPPNLVPLETTLQTFQLASRSRTDLADLLYDVSKVEDDSCRRSKALAQAEQQLTKATRGKCPLCGRSTKER